MASSSSSLTDEKSQCNICLDTFTYLVSTSCGHSFCKDCFGTCWEIGQVFDCPVCKKEFKTEPELKINTVPTKVVVDDTKLRENANKSHVPCDVCCGNKQTALKSCLHCVTSFCDTHLDSHKTAPRLMRHKLVNPVENLEDYVCASHEKPLEMFCKDDQTLMCVFCTETEHKTHDTVALEQESLHRRIQLEKQQEDVQMMIRERRKKIKWIRSLAKINKRNSERDKACSLDLFSALISSIMRCQSELLEEMEQRQKAAEKQAEDLMKDLEQEITELKRRGAELEQLSETQDHLRFLQTCSSACSRLLMKSWTNVSIDTDLNTEILKKTLTCLQENVQMEVKFFFKTTQPSVIQGFNFIPTSESSASILRNSTAEPNTANGIFVFGSTNTDPVSKLPPLVPESSSGMEKKCMKKDAPVPIGTQRDVLLDFLKTKTSNALKEGEIYFTLGKTDKSTPLRNSVENNTVQFKSVGEDLTTIQKLYAVDVVLESNTANPKLILSRNGKQVRHGGTWRDVPNNPERFDTSACVLGKDGFCCGKFYYEVTVGENEDWDVGVAGESINRKGKITLCPEKGFWTISLRNGNQYVANESNPVCLSLKQKPQTLGVFVDYEEGLLSFYDVKTKCLLHSFMGQSFTEKLYLFLSLCNSKGDTNTKPLIISTVSY